jgi:hypothetical protein
VPDLQTKKPKITDKQADEEAQVRAKMAAQILAEVEAEAKAEMEETHRIGLNSDQKTVEAKVAARLRAEWTGARTVATGAGGGGEEVAIAGGQSVELSELGPFLGGGGEEVAITGGRSVELSELGPSLGGGGKGVQPPGGGPLSSPSLGRPSVVVVEEEAVVGKGGRRKGAEFEEAKGLMQLRNALAPSDDAFVQKGGKVYATRGSSSALPRVEGVSVELSEFDPSLGDFQGASGADYDPGGRGHHLRSVRRPGHGDG